MILVTGAAGFVGRHVVHSLVEMNQKVLGIDLVRKTDPRKLFWLEQETDIEYIPDFDICDEEKIGMLFRDHNIGAVIHLASLLNHASIADPSAATDVNIMGSLNLLEAASSSATSRFVYSSSISVYGSTRNTNDAPISESSPLLPEDIYAASKQYVELLGSSLSRLFDFQFVALRIPVVVGPGSGSLSSPWRSSIFEQLQVSEETLIRIPYRDDAFLPMIHVQDLADILAQLVFTPDLDYTVYNCPADSVRTADLIKRIREINGSLEIQQGDETVKGIPEKIDSGRIRAELQARVTSIGNHLENQANV